MTHNCVMTASIFPEAGSQVLWMSLEGSHLDIELNPANDEMVAFQMDRNRITLLNNNHVQMEVS